MAIGGFVDWRGNPINREVHGGVTAAWFMYCKSLYAESLFADVCTAHARACNFFSSFCSEFKTLKHFIPCFPLTVLTVVTNMVNVPNLLNLVTYIHGTMHMGVSSSATTVTNFVGATCGFSFIGAFLSDSYITRSTTILLFGPLEILVIRLLVYSVIYRISIMIPVNCSFAIYMFSCYLLNENLPTIEKTIIFVAALSI